MARSSANRLNADRVLSYSAVAIPGDRPRGIRKATSAPVRRSERLQQLRSRLAAGIPENFIPFEEGESSEKLPEIDPAQGATRKRKSHETQPPSNQAPEQARKRQRSAPVGVSPRETSYCGDPIDHWRKHDYCWPEQLFYPDPTMNHMFARKKSSSSLRRRAPGTESVTTITTQSDPILYQGPLYKQSLAENSVYMDDYDTVDGSEELFGSLFKAEQTVPEHSLFSDRLFKYTFRNMQDRNEARLTRDISLLIVPSPENLAAEHLAAGSGVDLTGLIESTNEPWSASIKITGPEAEA
ncbi:hypothetical protein B0J12DRAFT_704532 [Macrophomina phaseolina]|uniref:DUF7924 domain-containing protein n=1 Tax=Macrophomina phaseolina TaxID=35725 RepID=A0ABQ8FUZ8_9PEZI|nr:hypothetical protein B0J12DRAFT_704532 [Macrophomina phaseolina]